TISKRIRNERSRNEPFDDLRLVRPVHECHLAPALKRDRPCNVLLGQYATHGNLPIAFDATGLSAAFTHRHERGNVRTVSRVSAAAFVSPSSTPVWLRSMVAPCSRI